MKKVLFICSQPFFQWRGSPIRVGFNVQALAELGFEVDVLTLPVGEDRDIPGVRIVRAPNPLRVRHVPIGPSLVKVVFDAILFFMALAMTLRRRYAVVHCVEDTGAMGVFVSRIRRSRFVFEKHSDPSSYRRGFLRNLVLALYAKVEQFTALRADAVIGTGEGLVQQVRDMRVRKPVHHIFDIPSSLTEASAANTTAIRRRLKQREQECLVTFVGSFAVYQGVDLLFAAIPDVIGQREDVRFVIIGGTPREIAERKAWLKHRSADQADIPGQGAARRAA